MVEKIAKVSSSAPSAATRIDHSVSIAEPDIAWVAKRQSSINADHLAPRTERRIARDSVETHPDEAAARQRDDRHPNHRDDEEEQSTRLSGESDRIGNGNLDDEEVPFGGHTGFV